MKYTIIYGIDVAKKTFDISTIKGEHLQFDNTQKGFKAFLEYLDATTLCVMEVTGIYHLELARFLYQQDIDVSVVNPLSIKRFIQMHLKRNKTDKADAKMIALYASTQEIFLWEPSNKLLEKSADYYGLMEHLIGARAGLKNVLDALKSKKSEETLIQIVRVQIEYQSNQIQEIEAQIKDFIKNYNATLLINLKSIKGIGERTATALIINTNGFTNFKSSKQLASYFGLAPTEKSSGTSINGSRKISKMGNPLIRKKLYMCSLQASKYNTACKSLYDRLVSKGKSKKLALIAVANKLLKIVFAIAKSGLPYDQNYKSYKTCV